MTKSHYSSKNRLATAALIILLTTLLLVSIEVLASEDIEKKEKIELSHLATAATPPFKPDKMTAQISGTPIRIKDMVDVEGVRDNLLIGYGLVVGLNGTGDKLNNSAFTEKSLVAFLERLGINTRGSSLKTKNVAAVTLTASLAAFTRAGSRINVTVSTMGDAQSLQGGVLLATPLLGADGEVYAVAQGPVLIGGFEASGKSGSKISKGVSTNGYITNGAIVEKEITAPLGLSGTLNLSLRNPDISTASRISDTLNQKISPNIATVLDPGTVRINLPDSRQDKVVEIMAQIEQIAVVPDHVAKIIVEEASGTIVMGENVRISTVAVAQGNLIVKIEESFDVSQPNPLAPKGAETVVTPSSTITVDEGQGNKMAIMKSGASLRELVSGLNALGVGPRDLITILQNIKAAGALQADIEVR